MVIACLGWGSLIWKSEPLPMGSSWFADGPSLPIEFSRVGDGGELATAVCLDAPCSTVLWAVLNTESVPDACAALREREQIPADRQDGIGIFKPGDAAKGVLGHWCASRHVDVVIWTALPPRYAGQEGRVPTSTDAIEYLQGLSGDTLDHAKRYIQRVPAQIDTPYRREIMARLGWSV